MFVKGPFLVVSSSHSEFHSDEVAGLAMMDFSPDVMYWGDQKWLIAMGSVLSYWQGISREDLPQVLRGILNRKFNNASLITIGEATHYQATLAQSPWRALLMFKLMEKKNIKGFVQESSGVGRSLLQAIKWLDIWQLGHEVREHLLTIERREKESKKLLTALNLMEKAFLGIGVESPQKISDIPKEHIWRRFSDWGARIWEWTWDGDFSRGKDHYFPWQVWQPKEPLWIARVLEEEATDWSLIEDGLRKDLILLSKNMPETFRITHMDWILEIKGGDPISVPISFRHPMDLKKDLPEAKTFLKHIFHNFWGSLELFGQKNLEVLGIKGWRIEIKKYLHARKEAYSLFRDADFSSELADLERRLSVPLVRYQLTNDPWPEFSYARVDEHAYTESMGPLNGSSERPLFLWKIPVPSKEPPSKVFLERVSLRWWEQGNFGRRDYYRHRDKEGQCHWLFKDQNGFWYQHGIFA